MLNKIFKKIIRKVAVVKKKKKVKSKKKKPLRKKIVMKKAKKIKRSKPKKKMKAEAKAAKKVKKPVKPAKSPKASAKEKKPANKEHTVYLGLGSNVGDREEYIEQAIFILSKSPKIKVVKHSTNFETEAEGVSDQPAFLNAAAEIRTKLEPMQLMEFLQETENALGREREVEWGPRTIDIDILFYDDEIISIDKLQIPHPLIHERLFALIPLAAIAPKKMHPVLEKTVEDLLDERKVEAGNKYDDALPGFKEIKKGVADDFERW